MKAILYFLLAVLLGGQSSPHAENGFAYKSWELTHKVFSHDRDISHHHDGVALIGDVASFVELNIHHDHDSIEDPDLGEAVPFLIRKNQVEVIFTAQSKSSSGNFSDRLLRPPRTFS